MLAITPAPGYSFGGNTTSSNDVDGLCTYSLQGIVMALAQRAGADPRQINSKLLAGINVRGYAVINTYPCSSALLELSNIFMFDAANYDGKINFVPRGFDTVRTIVEDDMVLAETEQLDIQETRRQDSISIPRVLHLNYFDIAGGLNTDKQSSERAGDRRAVGEQSLQTTVVMAADEARRAVTVNHKIMIEEQKGTLKFNLSVAHLDLTVADNIFVSWQGKVKRVRITGCELDIGQQMLTMVYDRQSAYTSNIEGYPIVAPTPPPSRIVGQTLIEPLDIHILRDADDFLGCYIAVSGKLPGWRGCTVELSLDGGQNYVDAQQLDSSVFIGKLTAACGAGPVDYPDTGNELVVAVDLDDEELTDTDLAGMLNRVNTAIVGNEVINFSDVEVVAPKTFRLYGSLLRGRFQTQAVAHSIDERFVLLDRYALYYFPAELGYLQKSITLRATSIGDTVDNAVIKTFTFTGKCQQEYAPKYLEATLSGSTLSASWQGVGKLGSGGSVAMGAYFTGYHVEATDGSTTVSQDTTDQSATLDVSGLSGTITLSVQQRNSLTGLGPAEQVTL